MKKKDYFQRISGKEYDILFGVKKQKKYDIHKNAFKKAWETRNFEIDKFWQRSMFFWGFIVLIFTGYITVITGNNSEEIKKMYLDFYMILLGLIFSFAWLLVICGSKRWQENWEKHIDYLEDEITGPLYKTLYYKRKKYYYSVSGITKILALVVIITWCVLLIQYIFCNCKNIFESISKNIKSIIFLIIPLLGTLFCIFYVLLIKGQTDGGKLNSELKEKLKEGEDSAFFIKDRRN